MTRNRTSAKRAGADSEARVARYLARVLDDDRIERRTRNGNKDRGDITGLRVHGQRVVVEVKDCATTSLAGWVREADIERGNDDALAGLVWHKRRGTTDPADWYVTMTGRELVALITGTRDIEEN